jgi:hypothetical protein
MLDSELLKGTYHISGTPAKFQMINNKKVPTFKVREEKETFQETYSDIYCLNIVNKTVSVDCLLCNPYGGSSINLHFYENSDRVCFSNLQF